MITKVLCLIIVTSSEFVLIVGKLAVAEAIRMSLSLLVVYLEESTEKA